jgi:putative nucleotide binding protein
MSDSDRGPDSTTEPSTSDTTEEVTDTDGSDATEENAAPEPTYAVVLDYLPHGRADDDRPQYQKEALAYAINEANFHLLELTLTEDADVGIDDRVVVEPDADREAVSRVRQVEYDDISRGAHQELEYVVAEMVDRDPQRFVDFYNDAQPITLRLHQLNLLPGIGKKLRNNILDERKRGPFESFEELKERVKGLHHPKEVVVERILEELRDEELKYRTFVGRE